MDQKLEKEITGHTKSQTLWDWLVSPHPSVGSLLTRKQVSHSAALALLFIVFNIVVAVISNQVVGTTSYQVLGVSLLIGIASFVLIKSRYHAIGIPLLMLGLFIPLYVGIINRIFDPGIGLIFILPLTLVITSLFISAWQFLILIAINLAAILFLPLAGVTIPYPTSAIIGLLSLFGLFLIYGSNFWKTIVTTQTTELDRITRESNEIRLNLQKRVEERTLSLDRRAARLEAAALVTKAAAEIRDLQELLNVISKQITERFGFYHVGIFLADENFVQMNLVAASSIGGLRMLARGHKLGIGREGIVGFAAHQKRPRIAQNVGIDAVYFNNPDLPTTRSEAALPLLAQDRIIGVLDIQSEEENAFISDDISILQTMTDQIALAIENIRLVEQSRLSLQNLEAINSTKIISAWSSRFGGRRRGFMYTPMGIKPLTDSDEMANDNENEQTLHLPLKLHGKEIGTLSLTRKSKDLIWSSSEKEMAREVSAQVALALENARLLEESQSRAVREQTIGEFSNRFSRSLDIDTLLQNAVREIYRLPQVSKVSLFVSPSEQDKKSE